MKRFLLGLALALAAFAASAAWPEKSVTLVVPFPPGGPTDQVARLLANHLSQKLGQSFVVDNRSGAGGTIGTQQVMRAAPDGYTLLFASSSSQVTAPQTMARRPYDGATDFTPVVGLIRYPSLLVGRADGPATVQKLIEAGHARELNYGSFGVGAGNHLLAAYFAQSTSIRAVHIPYRGSANTTQALLAGELDFVFDSIQSSAAMVADGKLRALAVSSRTRSPGMPDVPTLQESGLQGFDEDTWFGVFGPRGLAKDVVQTLNHEANAFLADTRFRATLQLQGATAIGGSSEEFAARVRNDQQRWSRFIRSNRIQVD
ncbi:MAG: tripartite tricarboxylate transporter substrate binding protein [Pseudomonadota bacterium]